MDLVRGSLGAVASWRQSRASAAPPTGQQKLGVGNGAAFGTWQASKKNIPGPGGWEEEKNAAGLAQTVACTRRRCCRGDSAVGASGCGSCA